MPQLLETARQRKEGLMQSSVLPTKAESEGFLAMN